MSEVSMIKPLKLRVGFNDISGVLVTTRTDRIPKAFGMGSPRPTRRHILQGNARKVSGQGGG